MAKNLTKLLAVTVLAGATILGASRPYTQPAASTQPTSNRTSYPVSNPSSQKQDYIEYSYTQTGKNEYEVRAQVSVSELENISINNIKVLVKENPLAYKIITDKYNFKRQVGVVKDGDTEKGYVITKGNKEPYTHEIRLKLTLPEKTIPKLIVEKRNKTKKEYEAKENPPQSQPSKEKEILEEMLK